MKNIGLCQGRALKVFPECQCTLCRSVPGASARGLRLALWGFALLV